MNIQPHQCRAARAWLEWTRDQLAAEARVGRNTVARFESGKEINDSTRLAIAGVLFKRGFRFGDRQSIRRDEVASS